MLPLGTKLSMEMVRAERREKEREFFIFFSSKCLRLIAASLHKLQLATKSAVMRLD